ncbi:MAG: Fe-S cluster assembly ATPase SufC [Eubacteriales bacterium]|nr:Fe-S cluster assembly ATPase SufC [Eubacteriales bacterium]
MQELLRVEDLYVEVEDKNILRGIDLTIRSGEIHVVMGPNGSGKSTLANTLMAHPRYQVKQGRIYFEGEEITEEAADKRAKRGIFLSFQTPEEIPGISVRDFMREASNAVTGKEVGALAFHKRITEEMKALHMDAEYAGRYVNVGFSGGEKKKHEMLQLRILDPKLAILDETDSGLDVDAVRVVAAEVKNFAKADKALLIITHHREILDQITPDHVHIMKNGRLVMSGDASLITKIEQNGYGWLEATDEEA